MSRRFNKRSLAGMGWVAGFFLIISTLVPPVQAEENCEPLLTRPVKVEAWMSKRQEPVFRYIRGEFSAMGHTRVTLWAYPAENPSKVVAVGRCVPAYIARHVLHKAVEFIGEINGLVHQGFISGHWIGIGTSLFAETQQNKISKQQLARLLDPELDTYEFQSLYRSLTVQEKKVQAFGLHLPNPKLLKEE